MINLACKRITVEELLKCAFNLSKTEYSILKVLEKENDLDSEAISKALKRDLSTVQRNLKSLIEKDLVFRTQINYESGGYKFVYKRVKKEVIERKILGNLANFEEKVKESLNKL